MTPSRSTESAICLALAACSSADTMEDRVEGARARLDRQIAARKLSPRVAGMSNADMLAASQRHWDRMSGRG